MIDAELMLMVKKERLDRHLAEIERLITDWTQQLSAPDPFGWYNQSHSWGWQSAYRPAVELDPDSNHMLRKHLRSRSLWSHHADWERTLEDVWQITRAVGGKAKHVWQEELRKSKRKSIKRIYTEHYLGIALWQAFQLACDIPPSAAYTLGDNRKGVRLGDFLIETSAGPRAFKQIERQHYHLSWILSKSPQMQKLAAEWKSVQASESRMQGLARRALKSSDFLYPCRFCRHLWKSSEQRAHTHQPSTHRARRWPLLPT